MCRPGRRRDRRCAGPSQRLWRLRPRGAPDLQFDARQAAGWSAAAPASSPTSAAAASSARAGTTPAGCAGKRSVARRLCRGRRRPGHARRHAPRRIAAEGGSNGGILISNMLTRYPDLFGALFCTIPLIDMRRYLQTAGRRELDRGVRRSRQARGMGLAADLFRVSRCCSGPEISADPDRDDAATTACTRATRARWRRSCRRWDTRLISTNPPPADTATARTKGARRIRSARPHVHAREDRLGGPTRR